MGFKAGFGTTDITPQYPVTMSGFAIRTGLSEGVHDRLQARAIAIESDERLVCLLILDLIGVDATLTRSLREALGLREALVDMCQGSELICLATHSHGAPAVLSTSYLGTPDAAYLSFVKRQSLCALDAALESRQPCSLHYGVSQESTVAHNRRDPQGVIDPDVSVLRFQAQGQCLGLLVSYACHPVVLGPQNRLLTRDYPGFLIDELESLYGQGTVLFATGCAGQINTGHLATDSWRNQPSQQRTFEEAKRIGHLVAAAAQRASEDAVQQKPLSCHLGLARTDVALCLDDDFRLAPETLALWQQQAVSEKAMRTLADIRLHWAKTRKHVKEYVTQLCALRLGELVIPIFPGEPFVEYALYLKQQCAMPVLALGYGNDNPGYLPTMQAYEEGGYEVADAFMFYGLPAPFDPSLEPTLKRAMKTLMKEVGCDCL